MTIQLTKFQAAESINKFVRLAPSGEIVKTSLAQKAYKGQGMTAEIVEVGNLHEFGALLDKLSSRECLSYGIPKQSALDTALQVVSQKNLPANLGAISRTRDEFNFVPGQPAIMMTDYDPQPETEALGADGLLSLFHKLIPEAKDVDLLWRPSAGSCIYHEGEEVFGVRGQRIYIAVSEGAKIPEIGNLLKARSWLTGYGYYAISKAGTLLERGPFDFSVWQPERLDFAGKTVCAEGLVQKFPPARLVQTGAVIWDVSALDFTLSAEETHKIEEAKALAREAVKNEAERVRAQWIEDQVGKIATKKDLAVDDDAGRAAIRDNLHQVFEKKMLFGDYILVRQDGTEITVGEILDNPEKYHNSRYHDPVEPEYGNGDSRIAVALLYRNKPGIYSHAHGGQYFSLKRATRRIPVKAGQRPELVRKCVEHLKFDGRTFVFGGSDDSVLVHAPTESGGVRRYTTETLALKLEEAVEFFTIKKSGKNFVEAPCDCPGQLPKMLLEAGNYWQGLPHLDAVIDRPICCADGSLLNSEGYDPASHLLLTKNDPGEDWSVPDTPTIDQAKAALDFILGPFRYFPFASPVDQGVFLAALLTAVIRPVLETAPGFGIDASAPGTGKTLLAQCCAEIATGLPPSLVAQPESEDEIRKVIFSYLLAGGKVLLIDNLERPLRSAALCAMLTSGTFSDRILGASKTASVPNKMTLFATGNGLEICGDLNRRFLRCRLEAQEERPDKRTFNFCPLAYVKAHRIDMIRATLVLIRAALMHNTKRLHDVGSFGDWNRLVRTTVVWAAENLCEEGFLDDPVKSFDAGFDQDVDRSALRGILQTLSKVFGDGYFTVSAIAEGDSGFDGDDGGRQNLRSLVEEIAGENGRLNRRRLGRWLKKQEGRVCAGLVLRESGVDPCTNTKQWCVCVK
ncbi:MAG: hypothetical protein JXK94_06090 [Deltaproteobacteria bacterium]|nr:hypothetical protein [Deltaproteobacteria bacterium]